jgi:4-amino-4-deoxychorismate lyase
MASVDAIPPLVLVNGSPASSIDIHDRGLHYGDGLFSTIAIRAGAPCLWQRHIDRLEDGCQRLGIPMPETDLLHVEIFRLASELRNGVVKLIITRGSGGRGYRVPSEAQTTRILIGTAWAGYPADWYSHGIAVRLCDMRLSSNPRLAGLKHLNRLDQVLARAEWSDPGIAEGLMRDAEGRVVEGTMTNLFLLKGDRVLTPDLSQCGVRGVMRALLLDKLEAVGFEVEVGTVTLDILRGAEGLVMCNALAGAWPVREFNGKPFAISKSARRVVDLARSEATKP